jgi:hypothetical protein
MEERLAAALVNVSFLQLVARLLWPRSQADKALVNPEAASPPAPQQEYGHTET